jgi:hypothetical protein
MVIFYFTQCNEGNSISNVTLPDGYFILYIITIFLIWFKEVKVFNATSKNISVIDIVAVSYKYRDCQL